MELIRKIRGHIQTIDTLHDKTFHEVSDVRPQLENLRDIGHVSLKEE
jgi:hypothetical protein